MKALNNISLFKKKNNNNKLPPGGPKAVNKMTSSNLLKDNSFLSYQPEWSKNYLSNSIAGWHPESSLLGIFKSSTNMINFFPNLSPFITKKNKNN